jgi:hypothetical protein
LLRHGLEHDGDNVVLAQQHLEPTVVGIENALDFWPGIQQLDSLDQAELGRFSESEGCATRVVLVVEARHALGSRDGGLVGETKGKDGEATRIGVAAFNKLELACFGDVDADDWFREWAKGKIGVQTR